MNPLDGIDPVSKKPIMKRIRESRRAYDRKKQRAELLIRNPEFLKEYQVLQDQMKTLRPLGRRVFIN